jgi:hypothetical protein
MAGRGRENADEKILVALACGATVPKAAADAGVSTRTVERRLADPKFRARLHQLRGETLERAGGMLTAATLKSVSTLVSLQDAGHPAGVRLQAAKSVLELALRVREVAELEARLAALETQLGDGLNTHPLD